MGAIRKNQRADCTPGTFWSSVLEFVRHLERSLRLLRLLGSDRHPKLMTILSAQSCRGKPPDFQKASSITPANPQHTRPWQFAGHQMAGKSARASAGLGSQCLSMTRNQIRSPAVALAAQIQKHPVTSFVPSR